MSVPIHEEPLSLPLFSLPDLLSLPLPTIATRDRGRRTKTEIYDESGFPIGCVWSAPITERTVRVIVE
jgi:hypothetical protein